MFRNWRSGASRVGLIAALVLAAGSIGIVTWFVLTAPDALPDAPDDAMPPIVVPETGAGLSLQFADKQDPSRLGAKLEAAVFRPAETEGVVEPGMYELEDVRAWVYLRSGETVFIESREGRFYMPDRQAGPESGSLIGEPRITVYPAQGQDADPIIVAQMEDVLRFNFAYSHIETPGRLIVTGRDISFAGHHLTARINQQRERIDVLEVERGESLVFTPPPAAPDEQTDAAQRSSRQTGQLMHVSARAANDVRNQPGMRLVSMNTTTQATPEPHVAQYLATFNDSVELAQGTRRVTADRLEAWTRLIDHRIPDRTNPPRRSSGDVGLRQQMLGLVTAMQEQVEPADTAEPLPSESQVDATEGEPVVLRWTGMLRVVPLVNEQPAMLERDDVALRFTALSTGTVDYADGEVSGRAVSMDYAMTREELTLLGPGGAVRLMDPQAGRIEGSKIVTRLKTGEVTVVGPGQIIDKDHVPSGPNRYERLVRWVDQADFRFEVEDGRMTGRIERADIAGEARAVDGMREVMGEVLIAQFAAGLDGERVVTEVQAYEASGLDGRGARVSAQRLVVPLETVDGRTDPVSVFASGDVFMEQGGKSLEAQSFSARLVRDEEESLKATDIIAERGVRVIDGDVLEAEAERLEASELDRIATLIGSDRVAARIVNVGSVITGQRIELDDAAQSGSVEGAGRFERTEAGETTVATWSRSMHFDRDAGVLNVEGDATVEQSLGNERRKSAGESVSVLFDRIDEQLEFRSATLVGIDQRPAQAEMRRFDDRGTIVEMLDLSAPEIRVLDRGERLDVPSAGRMVLIDHRTDDSSADSSLEGWQRGTALVTWTESLSVDQTTGRAVVTGDAQVIHRTVGQLRVAELAGAVIIMDFAQQEVEEGEDATRSSANMTVTRVEAAGLGYARMDDREVIAERIVYDPAGQMMFAESGSEPVRVLDTATGSVTRARSIVWDLARDRIEINAPAPLFVPRGG